MTTREIRTERIVQRSIGPHSVSPHNIGQLDNNLDNLLEDLQNSVSRPGSSLGVNGSGIHGGNFREYSTHKTIATSGGSTTLGKAGDTRMEYRTAANPITVPSESTTIVEKTKDGTKEKTVYKTIKYEYDVTDSISPETSSRMQSNINQLDTLLDDLQQARKGANINAGIDPALLEPLDTTTGTTRQVTKKTVQRELVYGGAEQPPVGQITQTQQLSPTSIRQSDTQGAITREVVYTVDDGTYGDIRQTRHQSPQRAIPAQSNISQTKSSTIQRTANAQNYNYPPPAVEPSVVQTREVEALDPSILTDLDPSLLPNANTKVTTTIKTYTYELPGTPYIPNTGYPSRVQSPQETDRYIYNVSPGSSTINRNEIYKNETHHTRNTVSPGTPDSHHSYPPQASPPYSQTATYKEENRNYYRGSSPQPPPTTYQTKVYKEDVRTTNKYGEFVPAQPRQTYPPQTTQYPSTEKFPPGGNTTIIHKTETYNTTYGGNEYPPNQPYDHNAPNAPNQYPPSQSPQGNTLPYPPKHDTSATYKYSSQHTTNKYKDYPPGSPGDDRKPLLQPGKFPTEPSDHANGPPKRLDELMASFDGPENMGPTTVYNKTTTTTTNKYRDDDSSKQKLLSNDSSQIVESQKKKDIKDLPKTKNVTGPPVYYPPGHEMFAKKEESSAAYSAQGGYMKASGKYEYEAESKSKSKSSSGAAVVPVCLPLCCAMPCSII